MYNDSLHKKFMQYTKFTEEAALKMATYKQKKAYTESTIMYNFFGTLPNAFIGFGFSGIFSSFANVSLAVKGYLVGVGGVMVGSQQGNLQFNKAFQM